MKKFLINTSAALGGVLAIWPLPAMAQSLPTLEPLSGGTNTIIKAIQSAIDWLLILAGALAVAFLVWGGIQYITGGAKGAEAAKGTIINSIIGIVIIVLAYVIVNAVVGLISGV